MLQVNWERERKLKLFLLFKLMAVIKMVMLFYKSLVFCLELILYK
jgi:hypothetical protein